MIAIEKHLETSGPKVPGRRLKTDRRSPSSGAATVSALRSPRGLAQRSCQPRGRVQ